MRTPASPEAFPDGARIVHIGLPKTGTSSLQSALHSHRGALASAGVEYAGRYRHSRMAASAAALAAVPAGYPDDIGRRWEELTAGIRASSASRVVLSSEILSAANAERAERIVRDVGGDVRIVLTLRPLASVLASRWQQSVQDQYTGTFDAWLDDVFARRATMRSFWHRYGVDKHVERWGRLVGEENVTLVVVDPTDRSMLLHTFDRMLGLPLGTLQPETGFHNASLSYPVVEAVRRVGVLFRELDLDRGLWVNSVRKLGMPQLKLQDASAARVQTPRWAAERANEASAAMIEKVRASDATVLGDLQHLLADPAAYPERQETPQAIGVADAADLATALWLAGAGSAEASGRGLDRVPARTLASELARRASRRVRRRSSGPDRGPAIGAADAIIAARLAAQGDAAS